MGGRLENLEVRLIEGTSRSCIDDFDAKKARCFTEEVTTRLWKVIEASGCAKINKLVSDVFAQESCVRKSVVKDTLTPK